MFFNSRSSVPAPLMSLVSRSASAAARLTTTLFPPFKLAKSCAPFPLTRHSSQVVDGGS